MNAVVKDGNAASLQKKSLLDQMRANPRLPVIIGAAFAMAAIAAFWLWSRAPDYRVLFSKLDDRDGGAIIAQLQQMNIPYKLAEGGGAIMVVADQVHEARLRLASQGLPKGGAVGFELMDNEKFGVSAFAEQVNYQRSLEGELARSIESIGAVEAARVHLALPKPSLFVREQQQPSASVVLTLRHGRSLDESQVSAVAYLISSSVPELNVKNVTLVDQGGNLLSAPNSGNRGLDASQLKYAQDIEQTYIRRIEAILQPIVGARNVRAQVAADVDFSTVENTDEKYHPNQEGGSGAMRSQQSSDSNQSSANTPGGVPGALSNQPPPNPVAPITNPAAKPGAPNSGIKPLATSPAISATSGPGNPGNTRRDVTTNYELDRSISHTQQSAGGIKRLSVAVVVNYRDVANSKGDVIAKALSATELEQVRNLVKEAMGYNDKRGDSLNVVNSQFAAINDNSAPPQPWWRQPENIALAKDVGQYLMFGIFALWIWFGLVRPLLRKHLQGIPVADPRFPLISASGSDPDPRLKIALNGEAQERRVALHESNLQYAKDIAEKDPRLVAMVIKNWMGNDE